MLVLLFASAVSYQLFVPPVIGIADNGDFGRMIGRFDLGPADKTVSDEYQYVTTHWIYDTQYHWVSDDVSSELILVFSALLAGWTSSSSQFDIRWMGAVHAALWVICFVMLLLVLRALPARSRWATAVAALILLTDVSYVSICNSFYRDAATLLFLGLAATLWLLAATRPPSMPLLIAFSIAAALCGLSKSQHAPLGLFLFGLGVVAARRFDGRQRKTVAFLITLTIPLAAWAEYRLMPEGDNRMPQYGVVFRKILERSRTPSEDLRELGLGTEYAQFIGRGRTQLPDQDAEQRWWREFLGRATRAQVLLFDLRHPWRTAAMLYRDLRVAAADRKLRIFGKYGRESGYPALAQPQSFEWWTDLRSALFRRAPWHILLWFAAVIWISVAWLRRGGAEAKRFALFTLTLAAMALVELLISSLSDSGETERHLFLFHVLTDFTILCGVAWLAAQRGISPRRRTNGVMVSP